MRSPERYLTETLEIAKRFVRNKESQLQIEKWLRNELWVGMKDSRELYHRIEDELASEKKLKIRLEKLDVDDYIIG